MLKLFQKPHITALQKSHIFNPVFEHDEAGESKSKGKPLIFFGINFSFFEHIGVNHARAENLQPAGMLAHPATLARTQEA